jgi:transcriptional regulator with XRE-family HTH domain
MSERAQRDPRLDEWRENVAAELRAWMARARLSQSDAARALGMSQTAFNRRMLGEVSFAAEELYWLADWMNRNIDDVLAAAKVDGATNPCLSHSGIQGSEREDQCECWECWKGRGNRLAKELYPPRLVGHVSLVA